VRRRVGDGVQDDDASDDERHSEDACGIERFVEGDGADKRRGNSTNRN